MAEHVKVRFANGGPPLTDESPCIAGFKTEVTEFEISLDGGARRVVFHTNPRESTVNCFEVSTGEFKLESRLASLLSEGDDIKLVALFKRGLIKELWVGTEGNRFNLLPPWRSGALGAPGVSFEVLKRIEPHERKLFERYIVQSLSFKSRKSSTNLSLWLSFAKIEGGGDLTPVFHSMAKLTRDNHPDGGKTDCETECERGKLEAYGFLDPLDEDRDIQLVLLPESVFRPPGRLSKEGRRWFLAMRDLPYGWGHTVWNGVLSEQIRVSQINLGHGSIFSPILSDGANPDLGWDVLFELKENLSEKPVTHALRLRARGKESDEASLRASFPLLRDHQGAAVQADLPLKQKPRLTNESTPPESSDLRELFDRPGLSLSLGTKKTITSPGSPVIRVGALDIRFTATSPAASGESEPELRWELVPSTIPGSGKAYQAEQVFVQFDWAVDRITPGGQDDLTGELYVDCDDESKKRLEEDERKEREEIECKLRRERPLVVPLSTQEAQKLILNVGERARQRDTRRIDLKLRRPATAAAVTPPKGKLKDLCSDDSKGLDRVAVLDREPFLVAKVSFPSLGSLKDPAASNEIANWQSYGHDAGAWQIRFPDAQNFCMTLPPQGVGETMEKQKTLPDDKLADFRLSPPALLSMRETYYQQNFPEAPWNLRRLLSDPGRELPGAHLTELQYELLYGLSCRIDYPFMRLAEVSALVGDVMGPLPQRPRWAPRKLVNGVDQQDPEMVKRYNEARTRWVDTSQRTRQRLGIFELWDIRRLDTLELKENVTCWIRQMPGDQKLPGSSTDTADQPKTLPAELVKVPKADLANPFDPSSSGLQGGVTWGFESRNIYQAVLRPSPEDKWPRSGGAEMRDTRLSALGGYGHQMSAFDNWRTKILADVSMGRTYSYTLERIGRIGVWWNRAKHVIIYERTVVRSRQFGPEVNGTVDEQYPLEGRAVLRKVEEYVEILQNNRKYPDSEQGNPKATGFVTECSFSDDPNQIIRFRVRSSWGTDIGKVGWKVPIWRPHEKPADLYPKPVVNLTVLASVDGESVPRKVTIADPGNLYFFTSTEVTPAAQNDPSVDLSNTDAWAPVEGVDFVDEARPRPKEDKAFQGGSLQQSSSGDQMLPSGFRPCTFLIEPAEHTVDLLANRKEDPMGTALSSVTLCRAKLEEKAQGISEEYRKSKEGIEDTVKDWLGKLPGEGRISDSINLDQGIADLCAKASGSVKDWNERIKGIQATPGAQVGDLVKRATDQAFDKINLALESMLGRAEQSDLGRALLASLEAVKKEKSALENKVPPVPPEEIKKALEDRLKQEISHGVGIVAQRVDGFLPSPAVLTDSVLGALREAHGSLDEIQKKSEGFRNEVKDGLSASADLAAIEREAQLYIERLDGTLERLRRLAEAGARIEIEFGGSKKSVPFVQGAKKAVDYVQNQLKGIDAQLSQARDAVAILRTWHGRFNQMTQGARDRVSTLLKEATAWIGTAKAALVVLDQEIKSLDKIEEKIRATKDRWIKAPKDLTIPENPKSLETTLRDTAKDIVAALPDELVFPGQWTTILQEKKDALVKDLRTVAEGLVTDTLYKEWFTPLPKIEDPFKERCAELQSRLQDLLAGVGKDAKVVRQFLEERRDEILRDLDETFGEDIRTARKILGEVEPVRQNVLNLVRAFGKPPEVSGLEFDRPEVAFFYNEIKDRVDVTPVIARAAQAGAILDALKPFGVDLPVQELGEQLIPASLKNFDLSSILPNISGIPLQNLFSGLKMPDLSSDSVKVTHGVDVQTRRAWVNTEVNFQIPGNATLFALGPLAVSINRPLFKAEARMEADLKGIQQRRVNGLLSGDWKLQIGGFELITFKETPLEFDGSGRVRFEVDPKNVMLAEALKFINELLSTMSPGGLSIRFDGDGVVSTLDLPIPDTQLGAFGFSGLTLCASLALRYSGGDFSIGVTAGLARRDAPFTLTIFILGGGGYLELGSRYHPSTGKIAATADMAIAVSASLAIALGPIRGGVAVYVGVTANYDSARGGGLVVGLMVMIRGHVSILSIASATIVLRLDAQYQGRVLIGRGHFEIKIKICWCFTLEVSESVTYTLGRAGSQSGRLGGPQPVAQLASLGGPGSFADGSPRNLATFKPGKMKDAVEAYLDMLV